MKRIIFGVIVVLGCCFYFVTDKNEIANDYYDTVNEDFFTYDYLGDNEYIYNTFVVAQEKSNEVRNDIVRGAINGEIGIDSDYYMAELYNNVVDVEERDNIGLGSLGIYIDRVMESTDIDSFISNCIMIEKSLGIDIFMRKVVDRDFLDNSKNIVYLYPVTFAFGSSGDYFVDDDYMAYKAYIKRAIVNLLERYGCSKSEARMISREVISFYEEISKESNLNTYYEDVTNYYNIVDKEYIKEVYSKLDVEKYFLDISKDSYSLVDEGQYRKINEYLSDKYLLLWKKCVLVKVLSSYAGYLDMGYRDIVIELNNSLTGTSNEVLLEDEAIEIVSNIYSDKIDKEYDNRVITSEDKTYLYNLFMDIKEEFKSILKGNDWLREETIDQAVDKLDKMKVYIGDYDDYFYDIEVEGDNLIDNIIAVNKSNYDNELKRLEDNVSIKALSEVLVNAYYNPMTNAVYIPSSVMFLISDDDSYYEKLGTIGMIVAHEVTHGFDYNGSLFDGSGNLSNWWSDVDRENYSKLRDKVVKYYDGIEVLKGKYINGNKTVNENIADMGALKIITGVTLNSGGEKNDLQEMYEAFADFWKCQVTEEYAKLLLLNDSHSPNKYRVNAVLSLIDEFYEVYKVYPWNDMYVIRDNRVSVWQKKIKDLKRFFIFFFERRSF